MNLVTKLRIIVSVFSLATILYAVRTRQSYGSFIGVPFEFRIPSIARVRQRWWNREDRRLLTPHVFGVGWSVNLPRLAKMLGLSSDDEDGEPPQE